MRGLFALSLLVIGAGPLAWASPSASAQESVIVARDAILAAADAAPGSVSGTFVLEVRASGRQSGRIFLNSEKDYRDQRNLTVAIQPTVFESLRRRLGDWPDVALAGKLIHVRGAARRVRIDFLDNHGRPSGKYYYQTHINVTQANQITIVG